MPLVLLGIELLYKSTFFEFRQAPKSIELFVSMPSLLEAHASIDTVSYFFLCA
jgi:hypothetical protein